MPTCTICNDTVPSAHGLQIHMGRLHPVQLAHVQAAGNIHRCTECNEVVRTVRGLNIHISRVHKKKYGKPGATKLSDGQVVEVPAASLTLPDLIRAYLKISEGSSVFMIATNGVIQMSAHHPEIAIPAIINPVEHFGG